VLRTARICIGLLFLLTACSLASPSEQPTGSEPSAARWALVPSALPTASATSLETLVWEVGCSSGRDISDKILSPQIRYEADQITVTLWLEPLPVLGPNEAFTCPLRAPTSFMVPLSEPLGDRQLVDGNEDVGGDAVAAGIDPRLMGQWQLVSGEVDGQEFVPFPSAPVTFAIDGQGASGSGGCNTYRAEPMVLGEHQISLAGHAGTLMSCSDGREGVEVLFLRGLDHVTTWELDAGGLVLTGTNVRLQLQRAPAS